VISLAAMLLWAALSGPGAAPTEPCTQISPETFAISGEINDAMTECVRATLAPTTTELVVDSGGGEIGAALDIVEALETLTLTVRVRNRCYSSCANYFLPIAARLIVEPGAIIVLHGGIDPMAVHTEYVAVRERRIREIMDGDPRLDRAAAEARYEQAIARVRRQVERQRAFAERHNVGLGWFFYREEGDSDMGRYIIGQRGPRPHPFGWRYMVAEEPLVRSCLPDVTVEPFQERLEAEFINNRDRYARFRRAEGLRSLTLECANPR
jgi:ATP-dependent protease ClpP protease subunit